jgi:hypothetical protein
MAVAASVALLLIWPTAVAVRNGLSDLYARPAIDYLEEKRFDAYALSAAEWHAIESSVVQAVDLMKGNPQYLEALGWLHQLKLSLFTDELSIEEMDAHADAARHYFQKAIESRPTWPYYWGNLALEQYRLGNYANDEYSLALGNASRFGPWKNDTQRLVMDLGGETYEFLSPAAKHEFILNVERALHRQPQNTVRILQDYGAWSGICEASTRIAGADLPHLRTLCADERFTRSAETR